MARPESLAIRFLSYPGRPGHIADSAFPPARGLEAERHPERRAAEAHVLDQLVVLLVVVKVMGGLIQCPANGPPAAAPNAGP